MTLQVQPPYRADEKDVTSNVLTPTPDIATTLTTTLSLLPLLLSENEIPLILTIRLNFNYRSGLNNVLGKKIHNLLKMLGLFEIDPL